MELSPQTETREKREPIKLTQAIVERAKRPAAGQYFIRDSVERGFALRVLFTGAKSFVWEGWVRGVGSRRVTLGQYPTLTVAAARRKAEAVRKDVNDGKDPKEERDKARTALTAAKLAEIEAPTFADLEKTYFERYAVPHKAENSVREDWGLLRRYVPKDWARRKIKDLTPKDVFDLHSKIGNERGKRSAANHLVRLLRTMFNLAKLRTWAMLPGDADNPATGIEFFKENRRQRFLTPDELGKVQAALLKEGSVWQAFFPLAVFLGLRRGELMTLRWENVDLERRRLLLTKTKNDEPLLLPLPSPAVAVLETLDKNRGQSPWVFPSDSASGHVVEPAKAWQRIRENAGVPDVRIHDLRHTLGSWLTIAGHNLPTVGHVLNHKRLETTQRYAHLSDEPIRAALEEVTQLMVSTTADSSRRSSSRRGSNPEVNVKRRSRR